MSFIPGWYIVLYGNGPGHEAKTLGRCSLTFPGVEGKAFLLVEDDRPQYPFRLLVRFDLVKTLEAIPNPIAPAPDPVTMGAEEAGKEEDRVDFKARLDEHPQEARAMMNASSVIQKEPIGLASFSDETLGEVLREGQPASPEPDPFADFERTLGEVRAEVLGKTIAAPELIPMLKYGTCRDCGDPWQWHGAAEGTHCRGAQCGCPRLVTEIDCFSEPLDPRVIGPYAPCPTCGTQFPRSLVVPADKGAR